jgi:hypothetical protein
MSGGEVALEVVVPAPAALFSNDWRCVSYTVHKNTRICTVYKYSTLSMISMEKIRGEGTKDQGRRCQYDVKQDGDNGILSHLKP